MTLADDHPDKLKEDLLRWVEQNKDRGLDWFLDEGPVAAIENLPFEKSAAAAEIAASPVETPADAPLETPAVRSAVDVPAPQPAPPINNPEFKAECGLFVKTALGLMQRQPAFQSVTDPLLEKFQGDPRQALKELRDEVLPCHLCSLAKSRTRRNFRVIPVRR